MGNADHRRRCPLFCGSQHPNDNVPGSQTGRYKRVCLTMIPLSIWIKSTFQITSNVLVGRKVHMGFRSRTSVHSAGSCRSFGICARAMPCPHTSKSRWIDRPCSRIRIIKLCACLPTSYAVGCTSSSVAKKASITAESPGMHSQSFEENKTHFKNLSLTFFLQGMVFIAFTRSP